MSGVIAELTNLASGCDASGDGLAANICRDAIKEIERLQAIDDRLPKCWGLNEAGELVQDVSVVPGMELVSTYYAEIQKPRAVLEVRQGHWRFDGSQWYHEVSVHRACYDTHRAAEAAKEPN